MWFYALAALIVSASNPAVLGEGTKVKYNGRDGVVERQHSSGKYKLRFHDGQEPRKVEQLSIDEFEVIAEQPKVAEQPTVGQTSTDADPYGVVSDDQHARLVRRSVDAGGDASNPFADPSTHDAPNGDDAKRCARLAEAELGVQWAKKLGGGGSGGVVFATTDGTVVKCGKGENMKKEGDVLSHFQGVEGVVQIYQMVGPLEGLYLVHMELLNALEWKMCFLDSPCDCEGAGCFPSCRKKHGHGDRMFEAPLTYTDVQQLIKGHVQANMGTCAAGWSQMDGSSGMNAMVTDAHTIKLIDFEQGQPIGAWGSSPWCNHDQNFMQKRIEEAVRCLPSGDAFRSAAEAVGAELGSMAAAGPSKCGGQCHTLEAREASGALAHDIADAREKVAHAVSRIDAMPIPQ